MRRVRAMLLAAAIFGAPAHLRAQSDGAEIMPYEAYMLATAGAVLLIDIRRPDEWFETGIPQHAHAIRSDSPQFAEKLEALTRGRRDAPIALICTVGVRTKSVQRQLAEAGYSRVVAVRGGILGSARDKGWNGYKLPLVEAP